MPYYINQPARIWAVFYVAGILTDPTTVTIKVQDPSLNEATYTYAGATVTKHAVGIYYKDLTPDESGDWTCRAEGTGACVAAAEQDFTVQPSEF